MAKLNTLLTLAALGITVAAVVNEVQKPEEERTWEGNVGPVPYDFTMPTVEKIKDRLWNPDSDKILSPHIFGAGWSVNFARLYALGKEELAKLQDQAQERAWEQGHAAEEA